MPAGQVVKKTFEVQFSDSSEVTQLVPQEQNSWCRLVEITEVPVSSAMEETDEVLKLVPQMDQSDLKKSFERICGLFHSIVM